uniref:Dephospho-CoA kinase n=1 Tax=Candidatus Aschnera chinzeii TaxID=1485666 RepID=A0AAT9G5B7_9ENTR|nr:MAG: dephospho-CoA kinase [Candidatus Aschnera chinzeii]
MTTIIGLTGGIGAGKSMISNQFKKLNVPVIDSDDITKNIINNNVDILKMIKEYFGNIVFNTNNILNKKKIKKIIFNDYNKKIWLENLIHPIVKKEIQYQFSITKTKYIIWVSPLLFENNLQNLTNYVITINTTPEKQIKRVILRDHITSKEVKKILSNQCESYERLRKSDYIIHNFYEFHKVKIDILKLHEYYSQSNN